ncbi:MAG: hypothetical protein HS104_12630 [Polyangiaceae bacterium]|nr:hypothetical protein [Polyangiaceae bacterium]MBE7480812.1 hypothetical protein [Polyangiaceae bacterium]
MSRPATAAELDGFRAVLDTLLAEAWLAALRGRPDVAALFLEASAPGLALLAGVARRTGGPS